MTDPTGMDGLDFYLMLQNDLINLMAGGLYGTGSFFGVNEFDAVQVRVVSDQISFGTQSWTGGDFKGINPTPVDLGTDLISGNWGPVSEDSAGYSYAIFTITDTVFSIIAPTNPNANTPSTPSDPTKNMVHASYLRYVQCMTSDAPSHTDVQAAAGDAADKMAEARETFRDQPPQGAPSEEFGQALINGSSDSLSGAVAAGLTSTGLKTPKQCMVGNAGAELDPDYHGPIF
jgi:hypothetical protein